MSHQLRDLERLVEVLDLFIFFGWNNKQILGKIGGHCLLGCFFGVFSGVSCVLFGLFESFVEIPLALLICFMGLACSLKDWFK